MVLRRRKRLVQLQELIELIQDAHRSYSESLRSIADALDTSRAITKADAARQLRGLAGQFDGLATVATAGSAAGTWEAIARSAAVAVLLVPVAQGVVEGVSGAVTDSLLETEKDERNRLLDINIRLESAASIVSQDGDDRTEREERARSELIDALGNLINLPEIDDDRGNQRALHQALSEGTDDALIGFALQMLDVARRNIKQDDPEQLGPSLIRQLEESLEILG